MSEIPKGIWLNADWTIQQKFLSHKVAKMAVILDDAHQAFSNAIVNMLVSDFVRLCFKYEGSAVQCSNQIGVSNGDSASVPYLKDWHFVKEYPDYVPYITPMFFCDDWLNLYLDNFRMNTYSDRDQQNKEICCSDYRFVYMGVKANVCGKKRWFFLDPSQCHLVNMKSCVYNIFDEVSDSKYPSFKKAIWLECTQEAGEIIFVPSG
ncbi:hypothetical protein RYX36_025749, partial [Vicia faba]